MENGKSRSVEYSVARHSSTADWLRRSAVIVAFGTLGRTFLMSVSYLEAFFFFCRSGSSAIPHWLNVAEFLPWGSVS